METLYKLNNDGKPYMWKANLDTDFAGNFVIVCEYGIVGGNHIFTKYLVTQKNAMNELNSKYDAKRKQGYISIDEIRDDGLPGSSPVEEGDMNKLISYLTTYLRYNLNNNNTNAILPMRAKTYNGNIWKKAPLCAAQPKINGLRCLITAYHRNEIFRPYGLRFQSREGIYWNSLSNLEDYMLNYFTKHGDDKIKYMIDNDIVLDGELYIPGKTVNEIDHIVKDATCFENKLLQFWCYDIAIDDMPFANRSDVCIDLIYNKDNFDTIDIHNINDHLNNTKRIVHVSNEYIHNDELATECRDRFIAYGFEGTVIRNIDSTYQFGRRRAYYMEKYKSVTDGVFEIVAIEKEPKRNLPIITCRNDINNETFETRFSYDFNKQEEILYHKDIYIGEKVFIKFGERSGVAKVPFHIKDVVFTEDIDKVK